MPEETEKLAAEETTTAAPPPPRQYMLRSVVRSIHNRTQRAALPVKPRRKQYVGNDMIRLAHGRATVITEDQLVRNIADIKAKVAAHILEVRTMDGRLFDLETGQPVEAPVTENTQPQFPTDSVANDKNFEGLNITPPYMNDDLTPPEVLAPGAKPSLFDNAEQVADEAAEQESAAVETPAAEETAEAAPEAKEEVSSDKTSKASSGKKKNR